MLELSIGRRAYTCIHTMRTQLNREGKYRLNIPTRPESTQQHTHCTPPVVTRRAMLRQRSRLPASPPWGYILCTARGDWIDGGNIPELNRFRLPLLSSPCFNRSPTVSGFFSQ